jgi:hypothetical protein
MQHIVNTYKKSVDQLDNNWTKDYAIMGATCSDMEG